MPGIGPNVGAFVTKLLPHWFVFSFLYLSIGPRLIDTQGIKELSTFTFVDQIQLSNCMCCWMLVNWIYRGLCRIYITLSPRHPILSLEPLWGGWFDIVKKWRWIFNDMDRALSSLIVEKLLQQASSVSEAFRCVYHVQVRFWNHHFVSWLLGVQDPEQESSCLRAVWCDSNFDVLSDNYERIGFDILQLLSMFHLASIITTPLNIIIRDCYHPPPKWEATMCILIKKWLGLDSLLPPRDKQMQFKVRNLKQLALLYDLHQSELHAGFMLHK